MNRTDVLYASRTGECCGKAAAFDRRTEKRPAYRHTVGCCRLVRGPHPPPPPSPLRVRRDLRFENYFTRKVIGLGAVADCLHWGMHGQVEWLAYRRTVGCCQLVRGPSPPDPLSPASTQGRGGDLRFEDYFMRKVIVVG